LSGRCQAFVSPRIWIARWYAGNFAFNKMAAACNSMTKKNWFLLIIIITATLLIAIVFWIYAKRIEHIENKMIRSRLSGHCVSASAEPRNLKIM
jgi:nitric oxide reductase large subunit